MGICFCLSGKYIGYLRWTKFHHKMTDQTIENTGMFHDFSTQYAQKYTINNSDKIGEGAYGSVWKGNENFREIPVAVKIHHDGIKPKGAERGWTISTMVSHPQIAKTYTIESFLNREGLECMAVVSQLVPGKSLKSIFGELNDLSPEDRELFQDDLAHSFVPSLLDILQFCHSRSYGHGDLHEGNIMVFITGLEVTYEFTAILIDFDNASIQTEKYCPTEKNKIEKDYSLLKRILEYTLGEWSYYGYFEPLPLAYTKVSDLNMAWKKVLEFIRLSNKPGFYKPLIFSFLSTLIPLELTVEHLRPILNAIKAISINKGKGEDYGWALEDFQDAYVKYQEMADLRDELNFIENAEAKTRMYKKVFDNLA